MKEKRNLRKKERRKKKERKKGMEYKLFHATTRHLVY
jgi:hypothetical protein